MSSRFQGDALELHSELQLVSNSPITISSPRSKTRSLISIAQFSCLSTIYSQFRFWTSQNDTREIVFSDIPQMTPELEKILDPIMEDIKMGRNLSPSFKNMDEAINYLEKQ